ncbi:hypothetical protein [Pseudonocardia sp. WMMC193]|uniref:hypothetical protein n=1 Tax=Pseudonocardia sp. WMMC193 TaxID=2911965 RepID=UPI001F16C1E1|nr:hypothetical protein [Pseudonocardia sp. WMMC193]MCF7548520.1 hypothetical protein [Pseudonocardia sp. WMMC193]
MTTLQQPAELDLTTPAPTGKPPKPAPTVQQRLAAIGVARLPHGIRGDRQLQALVEWAESWSLTLDPAGACTHWLLNHGRCSFGCNQPDHTRPLWAQRVTAWTHHGQPVLLVARPDRLTGPSISQLASAARTADIEVAGIGWGGVAEVFVQIWRPGAEVEIRGHLGRTEGTA